MKKLSLIFILLFLFISTFSQPCLPGGIVFTQQQHIDDFNNIYPNCSKIEGNVTIKSPNITNLDGLIQLTSIGGYLSIVNTEITSLKGLDSLNSIGLDFHFEKNDQVIDFSEFENLQHIGENLTVSHNLSLHSLQGLENTAPNGIWIDYNTRLNNLSGLEGFNISNGIVMIRDNPELVNLNGLNNLESVEIALVIFNNAALINLIGLENLTHIGIVLEICWNDALLDLTGLHKLETINGGVTICKNQSLRSLDGLNNLDSVNGNFRLWDHDSLTSLNALNSFEYLGEHLEIINNSALGNLEGLDSLTAIGEYLLIQDNNYLSNIQGLSSVSSIAGNLMVINNDALSDLYGLENIEASSIGDLVIRDNLLLSTCEVQSVCEYLLAPNGETLISNNATGCNSQEEVEVACEITSMDERLYLHTVQLFPNPAHQEVVIRLDDFVIDEVCIFTITGQQVLQERPVDGTVDISHLQAGMYIVEGMAENRKFRQKLLVQR